MKKFISIAVMLLLIVSIGVTPALASDDVNSSDIVISDEMLEKLESGEKIHLEDGSIIFIDPKCKVDPTTFPKISPKSSCRYCYYGSVVINTETKQEYAGMDGGYKVYYVYERQVQQCNNYSCRAHFSTGPWQYKYTKWL